MLESFDFIANFKFISILVTLLIFIVGLPLLVSRLRVTTLKHQVLSLDFYMKLKTLIEDDFEKNYSTILVALYGYTKCELNQYEIQWFIRTPGAFKLLRQYTSCRKYLMVCEKSKVIKLKATYQKKKPRLVERLKYFGLYLLFSLLALIVSISSLYFYSTLIVPFLFFALVIAVFFLVTAFYCLNKSTKVDSAEKLVKVTLPDRVSII
ncbi:hypothetical protein AMS58_05420 [Pseudoalteromonas porphyrae]|uniref:hypothetical protein n=1 Tax=Pseudoalteromonas porphyrae TaxID=187330 RepID=UPI0006BAF499|nr:hypothetical protein [Pseudoalteromonas porphyrae]KPH95633.1 hypothetical protein AMS58_05420 [Pseudoalteromonas porphyrae]